MCASIFIFVLPHTCEFIQAATELQSDILHAVIKRVNKLRSKLVETIPCAAEYNMTVFGKRPLHDLMRLEDTFIAKLCGARNGMCAIPRARSQREVTDGHTAVFFTCLVPAVLYRIRHLVNERSTWRDAWCSAGVHVVTAEDKPYNPYALLMEVYTMPPQKEGAWITAYFHINNEMGRRKLGR